jgi:hypothetical protein
VVGPDGTINFTGFWGDYELTINGQPYVLTLDKGTTQYSLVVAPGDFNGDHAVDGADYVIWRETVGSTTDLRADGNGDRVIDDNDYAVWRSQFGATYASGLSLVEVPEPQCCFLLVVGAAIGQLRRRRFHSAVRADGNGDGVIDEDDYAVWRANFGTVYSSGAALRGIVPEPSVAVTTLLGTAIGVSASRRKRRTSREGFRGRFCAAALTAIGGLNHGFERPLRS